MILTWSLLNICRCYYADKPLFLSPFQFNGFIDLDAYDTIAMKLRGDGRCYISTVCILILRQYWMCDIKLIRCYIIWILIKQIYTENWVNSPGQQEDNSWQAFVYLPQDRWQIMKVISIRSWKIWFLMIRQHLSFLSDPSWFVSTHMERKCDRSKDGNEPCSCCGNVSIRKCWGRCTWCKDWTRWF